MFGSHAYSGAAFGAAEPAARSCLRCLEPLGVHAEKTPFVDDFDAQYERRGRWRCAWHRLVSAAGLSDESQHHAVDIASTSTIACAKKT
jgi:putative hydrolase of the HAD superfamily